MTIETYPKIEKKPNWTQKKDNVYQWEQSMATTE